MEEDYKTIFNHLIKKIKCYNDDLDIKLLKKAYNFAYKAHQYQLRSSGELFFKHPLEVAKILIDLQMDDHTICGGLLHDVVEDTGVQIEEIMAEFGQDVALLVDGVTKISGIHFDSFETMQAENFRKMIISMVKDIRVIIIKFADRLHNMRTIDFLPKKKRKRIAIETRDAYAPLAHRLGLSCIENELEDHALRILDLESYNYLEKKVLDDRSIREKYINEFRSIVQKELQNSDISYVKITWKSKHFYSVYVKMNARGLPYEEINDRFTVLIIVPKVEQCYFALGIVHSLFTPVHDRFKDYIATPKSNMYQSLHTKVIGPDGKMIEIQIRTKEMDRMAEQGIVVHWSKNKGKISKTDLEKHFVWLQKLLEWQHEANDSGDFMEKFKSDLFHDEVFVFSPKGDLYRMPYGSSPVDFAFAIHTDIGYHCIGAKIDRKVVPLNYHLQNGDVIEIITSNKQQPNPEWIKFVKTAKARSKLERWIKDTIFNQSLRLGEEILTAEFEKFDIKKNGEELVEIAQCYGLDDINQLYIAIGKGDISILEVLKKLAPEKVSITADGSILSKFIHQTKEISKSIKIQGIDNYLIIFGKCCQPIPGDRILGFISKGRGIEIHRADCKKISNLLQNSVTNINVEWDVDKDKQFLVKLKMFANKRPNFLKDISESISASNSSIVRMVLNTEESFIHNTLVVEVKNRNQLTRLMNKIQKVEGVISIDRFNKELM